MVNRKNPAISIHQTLHEQLKVDWENEYQNEYYCPRCQKGKLTGISCHFSCLCKLGLRCNHCKKETYLSCSVPAYIFNYCPSIECPNPLCTEIGLDGQKGWIYKYTSEYETHRCRFCKINFDPHSTMHHSWIGKQMKDKLLSFSFDNDTWDLRHFYDYPHRNLLHFQNINPQWYRVEVKRYLYELLKSKLFSSSSLIACRRDNLKQFGKIIIKQDLQDKFDINRHTVNTFLDNCKNDKSIKNKLYNLRDFFEWWNLESSSLIRSRDIPKLSKNDPDWLDEVTRNAIKQHLGKIPAPICCHYLLQIYLAARPSDVCQITFNCLVEENGKWYIKFFQHKSKRWHKILANRNIRKVIEEQQQWIAETFGQDYSYLFCHFLNIRVDCYPNFSSIKPFLKPPAVDPQVNPMVRIIRMLIEKENIVDANGLKPHFTGRITRSSRLQEIRTKYGMEAAQLYADHKSSKTTFQHYVPPTREQIAEVDLPFQELLMNPENRFLPWQSLPESLLKNPKAHELDLEIAPRLVVYGHCTLDPKTPCPVNLFPKCYGCASFRPSTGKLPLYERQYAGEQQRLTEAEKVGAELASEEAKATIEAMDKWLPELRRLANG
jgi:integrase